MAGTFRRPVRNWTPNDLRVSQARFYALELIARKMGRSAQSLLDSQIDVLFRQHAMLLDPGASLAEACDHCKAKLTKETVSPWMLSVGLWACVDCFTKIVSAREKRLADERAARADEERARRRAAAGGPVPLRRAVGER